MSAPTAQRSGMKPMKLALKRDNITNGRLQIIKKKLYEKYQLDLQLFYDRDVTHLFIDTDNEDYQLNCDIISNYCGYQVEKPYPFKVLSLNWLIDWYGDRRYDFDNRPDEDDYILNHERNANASDDEVQEDDRDDYCSDEDSMIEDGIDSDDEGANQNIISVFEQLHDIYKMEGGKELYRARY